MSLINKLAKLGSSSDTSIMSESAFFNKKDFVTTDLPILNAAFSGDVDGGFSPGITIIAGESKTFKTMLSLKCLKAYLDKYKDAIGIIYDTEYGITPAYIKAFNIDPSRILHIPVDHVEQLKFDFLKKLDGISKGDRVFFLLDSLGQIPSKKELDDAHEEKSVADLTRAKSIRSFFRLVTIQLTKKELPFIAVNHTYSTLETYSKVVIPGGTSVTYSANQIFVITKSQEKGSDGELDGWKFTINIHKSRYVKEKSKLPFTVLYEGGIQKYSGILDLALESGDVVKPSNGWYQIVDKNTGEVVGGKVRAADTTTEDFLGVVLKRSEFKKFVSDKFKLDENAFFDDKEEDPESEEDQ